MSRLIESEVLRHVHVERMFRALRERAEVMSPATLQRVHATLNSALSSAVRQQLITYNHATHVALPSARRRPHTVRTAEEWRHFSQFAEGQRLAPVYRVIALTGMRRGEAAGLRWEVVDLDGRVLHVRQQRIQLQGRVVVGPPKSDTGRRDVPTDGETADALRQLRARQVGEALQSGRGRGRESLHYVFVREDGSPVLPEALYRTFTRLAQKAGLRSIRLHDLRHAHASYALAAGVSMQVVQERLGHSSITLTADTYTSVLDSVAASDADQIAAFMDGPTGRSPAR